MRPLILFIFCFSCAEGEEKEPPPLNITESETCSGNPPVIEALTCENTGLQYYPDAGVDLPTFSLRAQVSDEDADFTTYTMKIEFDRSIDNALDESAEDLTVTGSLSSSDCSISAADIGATIFFQGGSPAYSTTYEWYVSVFDSAGDRSDPAMIVCTTPDEEGNGSPEDGIE
ncbi:MAG: hypothetical protein VX278_18435 [Myxococcota bacterium]|nr:hypothetical protein [Myxococcota bacterium]